MERPNGALHPQTQLAKYESKNKANCFFGGICLFVIVDYGYTLVCRISVYTLTTTIELVKYE